MQVVVEKPIFLYLLFLVYIDLNIFVIFFEMEELIVIEKEDSLFLEKLNQKLFKSRHIHGEVYIAMKLGFQEPVVHISDRIYFDSNVDGDHVEEGLLVLVGVQNLVGASGEELCPPLVKDLHFLQLLEICHASII